jgi:hypothetical protein
MEHSNACETQPHKSLLPNATVQGAILSINYGQDQTHKTVKRVLTQTLFVRSPFLQYNQPGISIHPEWWKKNSSWLQEPQKAQWNQSIVQLICSTFGTKEMAEFHRRPGRKVWRYHWFPHCMGGMQMRLSRYIKLNETSQRKFRTLICSARKGGVHKDRKNTKDTCILLLAEPDFGR